MFRRQNHHLDSRLRKRLADFRFGKLIEHIPGALQLAQFTPKIFILGQAPLDLQRTLRIQLAIQIGDQLIVRHVFRVVGASFTHHITPNRFADPGLPAEAISHTGITLYNMSQRLGFRPGLNREAHLLSYRVPKPHARLHRARESRDFTAWEVSPIVSPISA